MDRYLARRASFQVLIDGSDVSEDIRQYLISLSYTDNQEDECDDLQIKLQDRDQIWLSGWLNSMVEAAATLVESNAETTGSGTSENSTNGETTYHVSTPAGLWVREGPGGKSANVEVFPQNTNVTVLGIEDGWAKISYNGGEAYMCADYLSEGASGSGDVGGSSGSASGSTNKTEKDSKTVTLGTAEREAYEASVRNMVTGLKISATILRQNYSGDGAEEPLSCGEFELDTIQASGPPSSVTIKATSLSYGQPIRQTRRSQAWESYHLSGIAGEMAAKNGLQCNYLAASDPFYKYEEQDQTADIDFLSGLCHEAGLSLKCTNNALTIFSQEDEEAKPAVRTITRGKSDYNSYKLDISAPSANYNACRVSYVDKSGALIEGMAYASSYSDPTQDTETGEITDTNQVLEISRQCGSIGEAERLATYYLRLRNKYGKTIHFDIPGDPLLVAGANVEISGWGSFDGKYSITCAKHSVSSNGYQTSIDGRWIEPKAAEEEAEPEAEEESTSSFSVGDKVRIQEGAQVYGMGITLQDWCYDYEFEVIQVGGDGLDDDRIVIGINGVPTAAMSASDLYTGGGA